MLKRIEQQFAGVGENFVGFPDRSAESSEPVEFAEALGMIGERTLNAGSVDVKGL